MGKKIRCQNTWCSGVAIKHHNIKSGATFGHISPIGGGTSDEICRVLTLAGKAEKAGKAGKTGVFSYLVGKAEKT